MTQTLPNPHTGAAGHVDGLDRLDALLPEANYQVAATQWRIQTLQMLNWGGFHGPHAISFDETSTLIAGDSGTGKSTLQDAWTAVMMPHTVAFNGASNDSARGRARSVDDGQRTLVSYLRGKVDETSDEGEAVDKVLRGKNAPTWGAGAATFVDETGRQFTALRAWFVPPSAVNDGDVTKAFATCEGTLDLRQLKPAADAKLAKKAIEAAVPALRVHGTYTAFATVLADRLGIGARGNPDKALELLARIQAGRPVNSVDELFKTLVLDEPRTFEAADVALREFDEILNIYDDMRVAENKIKVLAPIRDIHAKLTVAQGTVDRLDVLGLYQEGPTSLGMWAAHREDRILETTEEDAQRTKVTAHADLVAATAARTRIEEEKKKVEQAYHDAGGGALEAFQDQLNARIDEVEAKETELAWLNGQISVLDVTVTSRADLDALKQQSVAFSRTKDGRHAHLVTANHDAVLTAGQARDALDKLEHQLEQLKRQSSRITGQLPRTRDELAAALNLTPADLPFLAELIDLHPGETGWRVAVETAFYGDARRILVPMEHMAAYTAALDATQLRGRVTHAFVDADLSLRIPLEDDDPGAPEREFAAGKLIYADHPFTGWIQRRLTATGRNPRCVETPADLDSPDGEYRITRAGQERRRRDGARGRANEANVIGLSNEDTKAELSARIERAEAKQVELDDACGKTQKAISAFERSATAYEVVSGIEWARIDVETPAREVERLRGVLAELEKNDDLVAALKTQLATAEEALEEAVEDVVKAKQAKKDAEGLLEATIERKDDVGRAIDRLNAAGVELSDEHAAWLEEEFQAAVAPANPESAALFDENLARLRNRLTAGHSSSLGQVAERRTRLESIFATFDESWHEVNRGTTLESYRDYDNLLTQLETEGLAAAKTEWKSRLVKWSRQGLLQLGREISEATDEIDDRLGPINEILKTLEFGAKNGRLTIVSRRLEMASVGRFRRQLNEVSKLATASLDDQSLEAAFKKMTNVMAMLRERNDPRFDPTRSERKNLLDVAGHVEIYCQANAPDGSWDEPVLYRRVGTKSGGESQELVAFIIGAALRYRLGDQFRALPRFAPVFLDEGFIKADAHHAGRAVDAWRQLGFQIVVAAPVDKVTSLERHIRLLALMVKGAAGQSRIRLLPDAESRREVLAQLAGTAST